jgi:hypothetical protein
VLSGADSYTHHHGNDNDEDYEDNREARKEKEEEQQRYPKRFLSCIISFLTGKIDL